MVNLFIYLFIFSDKQDHLKVGFGNMYQQKSIHRLHLIRQRRRNKPSRQVTDMRQKARSTVGEAFVYTGGNRNCTGTHGKEHLQPQKLDLVKRIIFKFYSNGRNDGDRILEVNCKLH